MDRGNRTPVWPIQLILLGFFLAAVFAPRAWERLAHREPIAQSKWSQHSRWGEQTASPRLAAATTFPAEPMPQESLIEREFSPPVLAEVKWRPVLPEGTSLDLFRVDAAPRRAAAWNWPDARLEPVYALLFEPLSAAPAYEASPALAAADRATPTFRPAMRMPMVRRPAPPAAWWPEELMARLALLSDDPRAGIWAWQVAILVSQMGDENHAQLSPESLAALERLSAAGRIAAERHPDATAARSWRRAVFALERRLCLWRVGADGIEIAATMGPHALAWPAARTSRAMALGALVERYETEVAPAAARQLALALERLRVAHAPQADELAAQFERANLRLSVTEALLTRLAPSEPDVTELVSETMDGARVRGQSTSSRQLRIEMVPDADEFRLLLAASGEITARTVASKGPGRWFNRADGQVEVGRELLLGPSGFRFQPASAQATASLRILDVRTKFDGLPIFDELLRSVLRNAGERKTPQARRRFQSRVEREAVAELEKVSDERLGSLEEMIDERLKAPLQEMGVRAQWIAGQTTDERATLRLRVAGEHQLGAHTPRPRAPQGSLASLQLHQSACNNVIEQLDIAGRTFTLHELFQHVAERLHRPTLAKLDGLPEGVRVTFASADPVQLSFRDGVVELALRVSRLSSPEQSWRDFVVRARYAPDAETGRLEREESIRLASTGASRLTTRSQIALRSIFTKVFSKNHRIDLLKPLREREGTADLVLSQFTTEDGWLAVAVAAKPEAKVTRRAEVTK